MNVQRYTAPAILFHWVQAAIVIWLLWLGWTMIDLPKGAERSAAYGLHKSLGLLTMLLVVVRLLWRAGRPVPAPLSTGKDAKLATAVHHLLYVFLLFAPLAGFLMSSFTQYPVKFFGLTTPKLGWPDEGLNATFKLLHVAFVWGGAALIGLHVAGAIKHALLRDGTLSRMLPWGVLQK